MFIGMFKDLTRYLEKMHDCSENLFHFLEHISGIFFNLKRFSRLL